MRRINTCLRTAVLILICACAANAFPSVRPTASATTTPSGRVAAAAKAVDQAKSLSEFVEALKNLNLTREEHGQLAAHIQSGPLIRKLEALQAKALAASVQKPPAKESIPQILNRKRAALAKSRADLAAKTRKEVLANKPTKRSPTPVPRSGESVPLTAQMVAQMTAPHGGDSADASIREVSDATVGQRCTIEGARFGAERGRVVIMLNRAMYYCTIHNWQTGAIIITVPAEMEDLVGYNPAGNQAVLWVKMPGGETGPLIDVTIKPDPQTYIPVISSMSGKQVWPGHTFIVQGRNFVREESANHPTVWLKFPSGLTVRADVEDFADDFVQAKVPEDFGGVLQTLCKIVVISSLDLECETNATFIPAEEIIAIGCDTGLYASCTAVLDSPILCLFGEKTSFTLHDFTLKNGWVVDDSVLVVRDYGINAGAYYVQKPGPGTTYAKTIVEVWADAYSQCSAEETLFIRGPQGVAYQ